MSKTKATKDLEYLVYDYFYLTRGLQCGMEVAIPFSFRADFIGINKQDEITVVEIKTSVKDFNSINGHNFIGHKNYYALTHKVFELVKDKIPNHIGVLVKGNKNKLEVVKRARTINHNYPQNFIDKIRYNIETAKQSNVRRLLYQRYKLSR